MNQRVALTLVPLFAAALLAAPLTAPAAAQAPKRGTGRHPTSIRI
jgi:hypothetical protein